jgi:uncharacterized protein
MTSWREGNLCDAVPLFPLPNVVLFPRAVLPLHIFEERYKAMTTDALAGGRQVAMALLREGWERDYYCRPAIEPVVCLGRILTAERLDDGKYNFLLQGVARARIVREQPHELYRVAKLEILRQVPVLEIDVEHERQRMARLFTDGPFSTLSLAGQFQRVLAGPLPTADIADLLAFSFLDDTEYKQSLLAETDVRTRIVRTVEGLERLCPAIRAGLHAMEVDASLN